MLQLGPLEVAVHKSTIEVKNLSIKFLATMFVWKQFFQWRFYIDKFWMRAPTPDLAQFSFVFMQFLGKFGRIIGWLPLPFGNPELAPVSSWEDSRFDRAEKI